MVTSRRVCAFEYVYDQDQVIFQCPRGSILSRLPLLTALYYSGTTVSYGDCEVSRTALASVNIDIGR